MSKSSASSNYEASLRSKLRRQRGSDKKTPDDISFELMAAEAALIDYDMSVDELSEGIVDGEGDAGVDAVYIFVNDQLVNEEIEIAEASKSKIQSARASVDLYIVQSKETSAKNTKPIETLRGTLIHLLNFKLSREKLQSFGHNELVIGKFLLFREICLERLTNPIVNVHIRICTLAPTDENPRIEQEANSLKEAIDSLGLMKSTFAYLGAKEIWEASQRAQNVTTRLKHKDKNIHQSYDDGTQSCISLISVSDYLDMISTSADDTTLRRFQESLFERNVRHHEGDNTDVNIAIRNSLEDESGVDFWWLNNGITIICDELAHRRNEFELTNPQIVNGLQTSKTILNCYLKGTLSDSSKESLILVRIIVTQDRSTVNSIIKATNHQNAVKVDSIRSLDNIHLLIEEKLLEVDLYYDRRRNFYKNRGMPASKIVSLREIVQAYISIFSGMPDFARGRPTDFLRYDDKYKSIFDIRRDINVYVWSILALKRVQEFLKTRTEPDKVVRNSLVFHLLTSVPRLDNGYKNLSDELSLKQLNEVYSEQNMERAFSRLYSFLQEYMSENNLERGVVIRNSDFTSALFAMLRKEANPIE